MLPPVRVDGFRVGAVRGRRSAGRPHGCLPSDDPQRLRAVPWMHTHRTFLRPWPNKPQPYSVSTSRRGPHASSPVMERYA